MSNTEDILLSKWLEGSATEEELKVLSNQYDLVKLKAVLDAQKSFELDTIASDVMWQKFDTIKVKKQKPSSVIFLFTLIASLVGCFLLYQYLSNTANRVETMETQSQFIEMAEGSKIDLSPGSKINYNESNWGNERRIQLEGQAIFSVSKGVPFVVETGAGNVTVLGTQFDVWTIDNSYMTVKCSEGKVSVFDGKNSTIINGGEQIHVKKGALGVIEPFSDNQVDWKLKHREYDQLPLNLVLEDLSRFYNSDFKIDNLNVQALFSGIIPIDNLDKTLKYLQASTSYDYSKQDNNYIFSKE